MTEIVFTSDFPPFKKGEERKVRDEVAKKLIDIHKVAKKKTSKKTK